VKKFLFVAIAAGALFGASARAAPPTAPMFNWSGFYVGANAGSAWTKAPLQFISGSATPADAAAENRAGTLDLKDSAFVGGIQGGFNWQSGPVLIGAEIDYDSLRARLQQGPALFPFGSNPALMFNLTQTVTTNWLLTARPRIGYATNGALVYATGGLAVTKLHYGLAFIDTSGGAAGEGTTFSKTKVGWTAGGGFELALANNWTFKTEYLHVQFGGESVVGVNGAGEPNVHVISRLTADIVRAGINYRFGH